LIILLFTSAYFLFRKDPKKYMHQKNISNAKVIENVILEQKKCFPEYYKTLQQLEKHDFYLSKKDPYKISKKVKEICTL